MSTNQAAVAAKKGYSTKELVLDAMFIALTYVFTAFVNVRLPIAANGGLIHLGNVPLFICAILLGKRTGMLAGAFVWDCLICYPAGTAWGAVYVRDRRCDGLRSWRDHRRTPQLNERCDRDRGCVRDQGCRILYRRSDHLSQRVCPGCFDPGKSGPDRHSSCNRYDLH